MVAPEQGDGSIGILRTQQDIFAVVADPGTASWWVRNSLTLEVAKLLNPPHEETWTLEFTEAAPHIAYVDSESESAWVTPYRFLGLRAPVPFGLIN